MSLPCTPLPPSGGHQIIEQLAVEDPSSSYVVAVDSAKSTLAEVATAIATGLGPGAIQYASSPDEALGSVYLRVRMSLWYPVRRASWCSRCPRVFLCFSSHLICSHVLPSLDASAWQSNLSFEFESTTPSKLTFDWVAQVRCRWFFSNPGNQPCSLCSWEA